LQRFHGSLRRKNKSAFNQYGSRHYTLHGKKVFIKDRISLAVRKDRSGPGHIRIVDFKITNEKGEKQALFASGQKVLFKLYYEYIQPEVALNFIAGMALYGSEGFFVIELANIFTHFSIRTKEKRCIVCSFAR
jgi:hypothetical protein